MGSLWAHTGAIGYVYSVKLNDDYTILHCGVFQSCLLVRGWGSLL